jgi:hypothetical protein
MRDLSAVPDGSSAGASSRIEQLEAEVRDLSARLGSQVPIAVGVLMGRYRWLTSESSFGLLREASQRHNVKVRLLADAIVALPAPAPGAKVWFPDAADRPAPLDFLPGADAEHVTREAVTTALLETALGATDAQVGNVQLADPVRGGLRIATHAGHPEAFLQFFAHVGESGSACALASRQASPVTISDVETSPAFTEESRAAMLDADCRAVHSIPLTHDGQVRGMVSTHYNHTATALTETQLHVLTDLAAQAGNWLAWHQRNAILDALEHLHRRARTGADLSAAEKLAARW